MVRLVLIGHRCHRACCIADDARHAQVLWRYRTGGL